MEMPILNRPDSMIPLFMDAKDYYTKELECWKCGNKSKNRDEVRYFHNYIGGTGYTYRPECANLKDCQNRIDVKFGNPRNK